MAGERPRVTGVRPWAAGDRGSGRGPRATGGPAVGRAWRRATCPRVPRRQFTWHVHMRRARGRRAGNSRGTCTCDVADMSSPGFRSKFSWGVPDRQIWLDPG